MQGDENFSEKCELLKSKLDHLLDVLKEEQLQVSLSEQVNIFWGKFIKILTKICLH